MPQQQFSFSGTATNLGNRRFASHNSFNGCAIQKVSLPCYILGCCEDCQTQRRSSTRTHVDTSSEPLNNAIIENTPHRPTSVLRWNRSIAYIVVLSSESTGRSHRVHEFASSTNTCTRFKRSMSPFVSDQMETALAVDQHEVPKPRLQYSGRETQWNRPERLNMGRPYRSQTPTGAAPSTNRHFNCHECHIQGRDAPVCTLLLRDREQVIENYETLSFAEGDIVSAAFFLHAKSLFDV